jgi:RNA polymerase-binding protein DksA
MLNQRDARLKDAVVEELRKDPRVNEAEIGVAVEDGVVTLTGWVDSEEEKRAAQDAAHRVGGVLDVANDIHVRVLFALGQSDSDLALAVRGALDHVLGSAAGRIHSTVYDAHVTLEGTVGVPRHRDDAERAVRRLAGVLDVANKVVVGVLRDTVDRVRRKLLDRQRVLFDDVDGLEEDLRLVEEDRPAEIESRGQGEAMVRLLDRVRERDRHELEEIQRALGKIAAGVYGVCEHCREPIGAERLEATPETRHCFECETELEAVRPVPSRPFEPGAHRGIAADYRDLDDDELAEAVRERIRTHGDPDLLHVGVRCHGGVVRLSGDIASEPQRQILVQLVADGMALEVLDRLRVMRLEREGGGVIPPEEVAPVEERVPAGRGMRPLVAERWTVPDDEGEPPETAPDSPIPEEE